MTIAKRPERELTHLQVTYLSALRDGKKLGKQLRGRLRRRGVRGSNGSFYRVIKRLKDNGLVNSERVPEEMAEHRRQEVFYELTDTGSAAVGPKLELVKDDGREPADGRCRDETKGVRACLG